MKKRLRWILPLAAIVLLAGGFLLYTAQYYHADADAKAALVSDGAVQVAQTDYGWFFDGFSEDSALIFYPGGKVEATAYAPLCRLLARSGFDVCLVEMPLRLAMFGQNKASSIMASMDYAHWYIAGHSLGGVFASSYAAEHAQALDGVLLLASYPTKQLGDGLKTLLIYGSEDAVLNREKYQESLQYVPEHATQYVIAGGNHAQFGSYGAQAGDGAALISRLQQMEETVRVICERILDQNPEKTIDS